MKVKIINKSGHELPSYATALSAGMDLRADLEDYEDDGIMATPRWIIKPLGRVLVPTGLFIQLPEGVEAQIRPRSGLAYKKGLTVLNAPGTIDADYRGEIKVLLVNLSDEDATIEDGERIAQMVVARHEVVEWQEAQELQESERGQGGFGSTGKQ